MSHGLLLAAIAALASVALAIVWVAPQWLVFLVTLALAKGVVVLGLLLLMRTGLVSFGQGLYFGLGAYGAALLGYRGGVGDAALMLMAGVAAAALIAAVLGLLLARYRDIFFAMLSLAFSMILYGLLVKSSTLGSTDGFNLHAKSFAGIELAGNGGRVLLATAILTIAVAAWLLHRLLGSHWGLVSAAIRDNELRVDYLGASVYRVVYVNYVIAGALAGLGGGLAALAVGHVDPETTYWTTSGEFVFIAVLGGTGSVVAPLLSAAIFEGLRTLASQYAPNVWQMSLGLAMLAIIMFLPAGLWSLGKRRGRPW
jgi:ABC-type branched-subunit amino acid transport system permease subunit